MPLGFSDAFVFILNLRSPSTTKHRRRPRLRHPIKISAPILHESLLFNINAAAASMNKRNASPESSHGVFYLVTNKSGKGKIFVKRPAPSTSTSPAVQERNSNFDEGNSTFQDPSKAYKSRMLPPLPIETTPVEQRLRPRSPVEEQSWMEPMREFRASLGPQNVNGHRSDQRWKGKQKAEDNYPEEEELQYPIPSNDKVRAWVDVQRSATYPRRQPKEPQPTYARKARHTMDEPNSYQTRDRAPATMRRSRGPRPGQTYEIVNRQIIRKSSDQTVELSTWREETASRVRPEDADRISVYYVTAGELREEEEKNARVDWRYEESDRVQRQSLHPQENTSLNVDEALDSDGKEYNADPTQRHHGTISLSSSEREGSPRNRRHGPSKKWDENTLPHRPHSISHTPPQRFMRPKRREKDLPPSPFHATRSGSTISSIKSTSIPEFESVLDSCKPSLLHIKPVLRDLGIRSVEHLRAITKLTPTTRDREIKEDALRKGISVMEWAIFVDKIFTL